MSKIPVSSQYLGVGEGLPHPWSPLGAALRAGLHRGKGTREYTCPGGQPQGIAPTIREDTLSLPASQRRGKTGKHICSRSVVCSDFYELLLTNQNPSRGSLYNEALSLFEEHRAQLIGLSVDSMWSHRAYSESRHLRFPLLADFEPKGEVARLYGVYNPEPGTARRALFVIDSQGVIRWSHVSSDDVNPGAHGILTALENLSAGKG
jgi:peroxiredoxin